MQKKGKSFIITAPALAFLATLLTAMPGWSLEVAPAQPKQTRPQLIVSIVIDGLSADRLELLSGCFGPDGFNRLINGGVVLDEVDYGPGIDAAGAVAMLYTGAEPAVNGVAAATTYSIERKMELPTLLDPAKIGNYTSETLSPAVLRVSTLADEVRIDGAGAGHVHALAPDAARAIIMGGHAGNSAFWINDANGNWATTTHYREVPTAITAGNYTRPLSARIDTISWAPSLPVADYPALPAHKRYYPFRHTFTGASKFRDFKTAAPVNREITDMAAEYLRSMRLGGRDAMDMLSVGYTLAPFTADGTSDNRVETLDAYIKLDRELARLLGAADKSGGNYVVLLAGTPAPPSAEADGEQWGLSTGEFSTRKAVSLLNMYLIALHGNGEWVTDYNRGAFYLNRKLIDEKKLNAEDLRADAAKFMMRMSGVANAYTIDDILEGRTSASMRRNTVVATAPDVFIDVIPGWVLVNDFPTNQAPTRQTVRRAPAVAPAVIYAPQLIEAKHIAAPIDARRIAPTVARILRIRSPNAAGSAPISEVFNHSSKK